jgi:hypothetical protein
MEVAPGSTVDRQINCISCGASLEAREGSFVLKYFFVGGRRERRRQGNDLLQASWDLSRWSWFLSRWQRQHRRSQNNSQVSQFLNSLTQIAVFANKSDFVLDGLRECAAKALCEVESVLGVSQTLIPDLSPKSTQ